MMAYKILKYISLTILILFLIGVYIILSAPQQTSDEKLRDHFLKQDINIEINYTKGIRSFTSPSSYPSDKTIIFIHGAPGSGDQFNSYLEDSTLRSFADVMSMDRHGYGYSLYGEAYIDIAQQADEILSIIENTIDSTDEVILISHSYGGPICAYLSSIASDRISSHIMLCPVIDPEHEKQFWFSGVPLWWPFRLFSSGAMKVAAHEKLSHVEELLKVEHQWKKVKVPTLLIQGAKDWLAPLENADYVRNTFNSEILQIQILNDESHFIPFNRKKYVIELIQDTMD